MNLNHLFEMQQELDQRIKMEHGLEKESLFERKVLALLVELGELANETRCFKFWSKKPSSSKEVVLEEYVDGIHFILSLGIEKDFHKDSFNIGISVTNTDLVSIFIKVYAHIHDFAGNPTRDGYHQLVSGYFALGQALQFGFDEIEQAYMQKNTINHERQNTGY
ncbi:dUTP diphosphatase [Bacillus sp. DJP31]|uniref:dUTP diphosphatase n=1 Tax=Bacillus sp. DJP31 TaxID=3409789 RepID=UPI003BB5B1DE